MSKHYQSGCEWEDKEIVSVQLQHVAKDRWFLNGSKEDGTVESARVSRKAARILLANGVTSGS